MNTHLADQEIQQLVEDLNADETQFTGHLEACPSCRAKFMMYKMLFKEMKRNYSPVVPESFAEKVMEVAAKKQEQKIMHSYRLFYGAIVVLSLMVSMVVAQNVAIKKIITGFHSPSPGKINGVEAVLVIGAVSFLYVCLSGYINRFKKNHLISDITFF